MWPQKHTFVACCGLVVASRRIFPRKHAICGHGDSGPYNTIERVPTHSRRRVMRPDPKTDQNFNPGFFPSRLSSKLNIVTSVQRRPMHCSKRGAEEKLADIEITWGPMASPLLRCPSLHHFLSLRRPRFLTLSLTLTLTFTLTFTLTLTFILTLTLTLALALTLILTHSQTLCHSLTRKHLLLQNIRLFGSGKDQGRWC